MRSYKQNPHVPIKLLPERISKDSIGNNEKKKVRAANVLRKGVFSPTRKKQPKSRLYAGYANDGARKFAFRYTCT